jgi:PhzF family phenazine biosynthesis protein
MAEAIDVATVEFRQVDVFTGSAFLGNPVAVVFDADGLDAATMQRIARWTNLSETTFVLRPTQPAADYRLRIFTPASELPFAGHPSVGTAYALLQAGRIRADREGRLRQECAAGVLPMRVETSADATRVHVRAPQARACTQDPRWATLCAAALDDVPCGRLPPVLYDNGPRWWLAELADVATVRGHRPDLDAIARLCQASDAVGLAVFADADHGEFARVVRAYCPADGIAEDPVTGSANACIAAYLLDAGRLQVGDRYLASQGRELDRDGRLLVSVELDGVWIGGDCVPVVTGTLQLPR